MKSCKNIDFPVVDYCEGLVEHAYVQESHDPIQCPGQEGQATENYLNHLNINKYIERLDEIV